MKTYIILLAALVAGCSSRVGPTFLGADAGQEPGDASKGGRDGRQVVMGLAGAAAPAAGDDGGFEDADADSGAEDAVAADAGAPDANRVDAGAPVDQDAAPPAPGLEACQPCSSDSECAGGLVCWFESNSPSRVDTVCLPWEADSNDCSVRPDDFINAVRRAADGSVWACFPSSHCAEWLLINGGG